MTDLDTLYTEVRDGFLGIHTRLDQLNGRTREIEVSSAVFQNRLKLMERVIFGGLGVVLVAVLVALIRGITIG